MLGSIYASFLQKWTKLLCNNCCNGITQSLTKHNTIANRSSAFIPALIFSAIFCPNSYPSTKLLLHFSAITKLGPHCLLKSYLKSISEKEFFLHDYFSFQVGFPSLSISPFFLPQTLLYYCYPLLKQKQTNFQTKSVIKLNITRMSFLVYILEAFHNNQTHP